jgi:hypothetical protein
MAWVRAAMNSALPARAVATCAAPAATGRGLATFTASASTFGDGAFRGRTPQVPPGHRTAGRRTIHDDRLHEHRRIPKDFRGLVRHELALRSRGANIDRWTRLRVVLLLKEQLQISFFNVSEQHLASHACEFGNRH